jgi:hypothetical protein
VAQQPPYWARDSPFLGFYDHSVTHTRARSAGSSGWVISPTQRPLCDNTKHSRWTDIHATDGFEPAIPACERPQTHALDLAATGIGFRRINWVYFRLLMQSLIGTCNWLRYNANNSMMRSSSWELFLNSWDFWEIARLYVTQLRSFFVAVWSL